MVYAWLGFQVAITVKPRLTVTRCLMPRASDIRGEMAPLAGKLSAQFTAPYDEVLILCGVSQNGACGIHLMLYVNRMFM